MADELHRHAGIAVKLFFKGKDAESLSEPLPHQIHAPGPPRPKLRANVIDISNALGAQLARQPQMKTGEVRQNRKRRTPELRLVDEPPHVAEQRMQSAQCFGESR